jgi:hypothetical protein
MNGITKCVESVNVRARKHAHKQGRAFTHLYKKELGAELAKPAGCAAVRFQCARSASLLLLLLLLLLFYFIFLLSCLKKLLLKRIFCRPVRSVYRMSCQSAALPACVWCLTYEWCVCLIHSVQLCTLCIFVRNFTGRFPVLHWVIVVKPKDTQRFARLPCCCFTVPLKISAGRLSSVLRYGRSVVLNCIILKCVFAGVPSTMPLSSGTTFTPISVNVDCFSS